MQSMKMSSERPRSEAGQAMTEFALVAPLLFLLLFGIIQFGLLFGAQTGMVSAVRNTARYASTAPIYDQASAIAICPQIKTQLTNELQAGLPGYQSSRLTSLVTFTWYANPDSTYGIRVTVKATYKHPLFVPLVGNLVDGFDGASDGSWTLSATETMRIENPPLSTTGSAPGC
jgi:Flp pilus assembly protein TadG